MQKKTPSELKKLTKAEIIEYVQELDASAIITELDFPEPKNVHEAINLLMGRVGYIQKQESSDLPYSFAGEAAFIKSIRPHMVDLGLTIAQIGVEHIETIQYETKRGAQAFNRVFAYTFEWTHTPTETHYLVSAIGEGTDYGDKSCNKSMTVGLKYALRQTLLIETGDDPDQFDSADFEQARDRVAHDRPKSSNGRLENQWEIEVLDDVMLTTFIEENELARPHVVNILNNSIFMTTIPYGELTREIALGYVIAWSTSKEKYPDDDTPARAERVNTNWEKIMEGFVEQAIEQIDGIEGELFESGLGYEG